MRDEPSLAQQYRPRPFPPGEGNHASAKFGKYCWRRAAIWTV